MWKHSQEKSGKRVWETDWQTDGHTGCKHIVPSGFIRGGLIIPCYEWQWIKIMIDSFISQNHEAEIWIFNAYSDSIDYFQSVKEKELHIKLILPWFKSKKELIIDFCHTTTSSETSTSTKPTTSAKTSASKSTTSGSWSGSATTSAAPESTAAEVLIQFVRIIVESGTGTGCASCAEPATSKILIDLVWIKGCWNDEASPWASDWMN